MTTRPNPYYDPEELGIEIEFEDDRGCSYEFDMFVIWKRAGVDDGMRWWETDSGCSCPTPFEGYDLTDLNYGTATSAQLAYAAWQRERNR